MRLPMPWPPTRTPATSAPLVEEGSAMGALVLTELLARVHDFDPQLVAYVANDAEVVGGSEVELVDYRGPQTPNPQGKRYLLSVHDIIDVLQTWSKWRGGRT